MIDVSLDVYSIFKPLPFKQYIKNWVDEHIYQVDAWDRSQAKEFGAMYQNFTWTERKKQ
jgi:hypothetical protein